LASKTESVKMPNLLSCTSLFKVISQSLFFHSLGLIMKRQSKISQLFNLRAQLLTPITALSFTLGSVLMTGCSTAPSHTADTSSSTGAEQVPNVELLGQLQLPTGARIINERTLILGAGDSWVGRITMEIGKDTNTAYSFFLDQYPRQGWTLVSAVRGANSLIVFNKQDRNATIEIRDGSLAVGATAVLTVTPRASVSSSQSNAGAVGSSGFNSPVIAPVPQPAPSVTNLPLAPSGPTGTSRN